MAVKWTKEQQAAIHTTGRSLLVSAAAGSGKTAVLAERCAYLVCDAPDPCGVDELLVVTFTNAAAAEMRDRIERTLRSRLESTETPRLLKQLALIDRAQISTLHGFCSQVLRQHFHVLGVDPNFTQLAEEEAALLRSEVARDLFADRYASEKSGGDFQNFIDQYGNGNDEQLVWRVIQTHELLSSMIEPKTWINRALSRINSAAQQPLHETELGCELTKLITDGLADLRRRAIEASGRLSEMQGLSHYAEYVNDMLANITDWQDRFGKGDFDGLADAVKTLSLGRLPSIRGIDPAIRETGKRILESVRDAMTDGTVPQLCRFSVAEWQDGLKRIATPSKVFFDLVLDFSRRYRKAKDEMRAIDFSDLERFALKVLRDESVTHHLSPTDAAKAYQAQFKHVLVDEYQDINAVQDAILSLVSRECLAEDREIEQNLFCVGDVKQSIYRFRLADPQRFSERGKKFRDGDERIGQVIDLQSNFRSRGPLIDVLNGLFQRLMTEAAAEIHYDETHMLCAGLKYPNAAEGDANTFKGAPVELHLLPKAARGESDAAVGEEDNPELERAEREAVVIAHRIREMMGLTGKPRAQVFEKSDEGLKARDIQYKDIVILLRSVKVKADDFADQLRMANIPVHSDSGTGFFESLEVRDVLSLLHLLDNQRQDIPMAAVLRSPLCKLPCADDCLAKIALMSRRSPTPVPFHQAVINYAETQSDELAACLRDFLNQLNEWRTLAHRRPLAELLWTIYDSTGYLAFCAGLDDGEQRVANLISLHERARQFGTFQRQGIGRFMRFIEDLQNQSDLGQPSVASDDVVRIMSIHRSKGLEFPVVFLPDLGKRHNLRDAHGMILVDRQGYLGMQAVDEARRIRYPSLAWMLVQDRLKKQMLAEELRVLYVATTRAREHLILLGTCDENKPETWRSTWTNHQGPLPAEDVLHGGCMLDWIGPAAAAMESAKPGGFAIQSYSEEELAKLANQTDRHVELSADQTQFAELQPLNPPPPMDGAAQGVIQRLTRAYPWKELTSIPAAESVTGLTKAGQTAPGGSPQLREKAVSFDRELVVPKCVMKASAPTATEIGSATHLALQHLDLAAVSSAQDVRHQLDGLVNRKVILAAQNKMVDVEAILWLAGSDLGQLLREHRGSIQRELQVYLAKDVDTSKRSSDPMDRVMVRGRLDLMLRTPDGIVVADYKTDRVTKEMIESRSQFYAAQINSYADAIKTISGQPIRHAYLAFLTPRILVDLANQ
jgi:ATP-dependent helicase/nuclease subunit A